MTDPIVRGITIETCGEDACAPDEELLMGFAAFGALEIASFADDEARSAQREERQERHRMRQDAQNARKGRRD